MMTPVSDPKDALPDSKIKLAEQVGMIDPGRMARNMYASDPRRLTC